MQQFVCNCRASRYVAESPGLLRILNVAKYHLGGERVQQGSVPVRLRRVHPADQERPVGHPVLVQLPLQLCRQSPLACGVLRARLCRLPADHCAESKDCYQLGLRLRLNTRRTSVLGSLALPVDHIAGTGAEVAYLGWPMPHCVRATLGHSTTTQLVRV